MRTVKTNQAGQLLSSETKVFGGAYSIWEKLVNNGVGSSKVIYDEGIELFDAMDRGVAGEISFVSFEILKNGLLLRLNQNQRTLCLGLELAELETVSLTGVKIEIIEKKLMRWIPKIVHRGDLIITERQGIVTTFSIVVREFEAIRSFFEKPVFADKFIFRISDVPPENDYSHFLPFLEDL